VAVVVVKMALLELRGQAVLQQVGKVAMVEQLHNKPFMEHLEAVVRVLLVLLLQAEMVLMAVMELQTQLLDRL
jgi:type III secretory pathway component EscU